MTRVDAFVALCVLTAVVSVALAAERVSTARVSVLRWLHVVYLLATAVWSVGVLVGLKGTGAALVWSLPARVVATAVVVAAVYCLSFALSDAAWRPRTRLLALLSIHPLVVLVAAATNPWHHLVVTGPGAAARAPRTGHADLTCTSSVGWIMEGSLRSGGRDGA